MRENPRKIAIGFLPILYALAVTAMVVSVCLVVFIGITEKIPLKIATGSLTATFADCDYTCHKYSITGLREGHRAEVTFLVQRRYVGDSSNAVSVTVYDKSGEDITYKYQPEYHWGTITVLPAQYQIQTGSATAEYAGHPLTCPEQHITGLLPGHRAEILSTAELTDAGSIPNIPNLVIWDSLGNDITDQYVAEADYGTLTVLPRKLTISSPDLTREYTGEVFVTGEVFLDGKQLEELGWLDSGSLAETDWIAFHFPAECTELGTYVNHFTITIWRKTEGEPIDATNSYILEKVYGTITIQ